MEKIEEKVMPGVTYKVITAAEYNTVEFGEFDTSEEALKQAKLIDSICQLMRCIEHAGVPHFITHVECEATSQSHYLDGTIGGIY